VPIIRGVPVWARAVASIAALLVAFAQVVYLSGLVDGAGSPIPLSAYALIAFAFGAVGAVLLFANRDDERAAWLGGVMLMVASQVIGRLIGPAVSPVDPWVSRVRPDAFLPVFLWSFVAAFPSRLDGSTRRMVDLLTWAALLFGVMGAITNLSIAVVPPGPAGLGWRAWLSVARTPGSIYWITLFVLSLLAFVGLLLRMRSRNRADRFRTRVFVSGIIAGFLPLFLEVLLEELSPGFKAWAHRPGVEPWVGLVLFAPLAFVPLVTAYSVIYDHIVDIRIVVRAAIQYAMARYAIMAATAVPFVALGVYAFHNRSEQVVSLFSGPRPLLLLAATATGTSALRWRRQVLRAIDRRFFREQYDTQLLVTNLMSDAFMSQTPSEIARGLAVEIDRAIHAQADLFVVEDRHLVDPRGTREALGVNATIVALAMADAQPMDILVDKDQMLGRLPAAERAWIDGGRYRLLTALRSRTGEPVGLLALSEKQSGLRFSNADRRSIAALSAPLALVLENERLRRLPDPATESPARECQSCSRLHDAKTVNCSCGGNLIAAQAPHVLRGMFRFEQRIGAGGMGVVYRATDLNLGRSVAIKTLPRVTPEHVARLRREAQAMAAMTHANLAVIYGVETWKGVPFLVEEYLAGGTLAQLLRSRRMNPGEALDLSITLTNVLGQLHAAGIVHCDIKPSNIGFNQNGVVKLLDFGLARLLRDAGPLLSTTTNIGAASPWTDSVVISEFGVMGTPPYMSPEASRGMRATPAVDLWAVAVVLYEVLAGRRPFVGETAADVFEKIRASEFSALDGVRPDCPGAIARFVERSLSADPDSRLLTAEAMTTELLVLRSTVV